VATVNVRYIEEGDRPRQAEECPATLSPELPDQPPATDFTETGDHEQCEGARWPASDHYGLGPTTG
jgi:hypothetical protein